MVTLSSIELTAGGAVHSFSYISGTFKGAIDSQATFVAEIPDGTTTVENAVGMYRKSISLSGAIHTDASGSPTAVEKIFLLAEFLRVNLDQQMKLILQLDGGNTVKTYFGKIIGEVVFQILGQSPEEVVFSFFFVIEVASWN